MQRVALRLKWKRYKTFTLIARFFLKTKAKANILVFKAKAETYFFVLKDTRGKEILQGLQDCQRRLVFDGDTTTGKNVRRIWSKSFHWILITSYLCCDISFCAAYTQMLLRNRQDIAPSVTGGAIQSFNLDAPFWRTLCPSTEDARPLKFHINRQHLHV